ncbi:hypothetical protein F0562_024170 [Nyssa sinensis]|uniref:Uncharacterized protein n=1 Tax=Nyssa sinensis TaxID=561372 RepID=A0A5J5BEZ9_9ASTE|nr:hypothetical protein F0562_024170 [Nyssa sinensis]
MLVQVAFQLGWWWVEDSGIPRLVLFLEGQDFVTCLWSNSNLLKLQISIYGSWWVVCSYLQITIEGMLWQPVSIVPSSLLEGDEGLEK